MAAIDEIIVKLDRAKEHLELLDEEIRAHIESQPYRFSHEFEHIRGLDYEMVSRIHIDKVPPLRLSAIFGDGIQNVRSALDHLVYQMSLNYVGLSGDLKGIEFPIFINPVDYFRVSKNGRPNRSSGLYKVRSVDPSAQAIIEGLQPYHGGDNIILWRLHDLSIIDKHRYFHLVSVPLGEWFAGRPIGDTIGPFALGEVRIRAIVISNPPFSDGAVVRRTRITVPENFDFKVRVRHQIPGEIVLDELGMPNAYASNILAGSIGFVRRKVVPSLIQFLP